MLRNELFRFVKKVEGEGAPDQPTIYGITEKWYPQHYNRIKSLVDNGASSDLIDDAVFDAYEQIYNACNADKLPYPLNWIYFDFYFNAGKNAGKVLQTTMNHYFYTHLRVDGVVGKNTLIGLGEISVRGKTNKLTMLYATERINYYVSLGKITTMGGKEEDVRVGWINRANQLYNLIIKQM